MKWWDSRIFPIYFKRFYWTGYSQMKLTLTRLDVNDRGIFGKLECLDFSCVTLERHDIAVPTGTYKITLYESPKHGLVPLLNDVKGRTMIEIHEGNFEYDSKGCILVGERRVGNTIENSKKTLAKLVALFKGKEESWITIK